MMLIGYYVDLLSVWLDFRSGDVKSEGIRKERRYIPENRFALLSNARSLYVIITFS